MFFVILKSNLLNNSFNNFRIYIKTLSVYNYIEKKAFLKIKFNITNIILKIDSLKRC